MKKFFLLGSIILIAGCGDNTPKCNSTDTIETAVSIIEKHYAIMNIENVELKNIRTTGKDKNIGMSQCAADADLSFKDNGNPTIPVTYTTQLTDDGNNIYVNIWGLQ